MNIMTASNQWALRPDDERHLTLTDLHDHVATRRKQSRERNVGLEKIEVRGTHDGEMLISDGVEVGVANHWSFGQLCRQVGAPSGYLRRLPAQVATVPLDWNLTHAEQADGKLLFMDRAKAHKGKKTDVAKLPQLTALTSATYGRIWDSDVTMALLDNVDNDVWKVPAASYATKNPKLATTLYASDRDVFAFLVNESNPIEVPGDNGMDTLFRGFYVWNSEVGSASFGIAQFLYRYVCDNRIIWGAQDFKEMKIRHTSGGPHRFIHDAVPALEAYLQSGTGKIVDAVLEAKGHSVGKTEKEAVQWLQAKGFTKNQSQRAAEKAQEEPGDARSVWNLVNGLTALAKQGNHTNTRVMMERKASNLLAKFAS